MAHEDSSRGRERSSSQDIMLHSLDRKLENRPSKNDLVRQNIIKSNHASNEVDRALHERMRAIVNAQRETKLTHQLNQRRTVQELFDKGILLSKNPRSAKVVVTQRALKKLSEQEKLQEFLSHRPSLNEITLSNEHIVQDTMTWSKAMTTGYLPTPRNCHSMTYIEDKHSLYLLGGFGGGNSKQNELLVLTVDSLVWNRPMVGGICPCERYSHTCSAVGTQLVLFGGFSSSGEWLNDLHVLDTDSNVPFFPKLGPQDAKSIQLLMWYHPKVTGTLPKPRAAHTASVIGKKVYVFGGNDGQNLFNDLYILDLNTMNWMKPDVHGDIPSARAGHTATVVSDHEIVFFGGGLDIGMANDIFILDTQTLTWDYPDIHGTPPSARAGHSACCVFHRHLLIFGGGSLNNKAFNDLHLFSLDTMTWSRPADSGDVPTPRAGHSSTIAGTQMFNFGGGDEDCFFNDLHILDTQFLRLDVHNNDNSLLLDDNNYHMQTIMSAPSSPRCGHKNRKKRNSNISATSILSPNDHMLKQIHETSVRIQGLLYNTRKELNTAQKQRDNDVHKQVTLMCSALLAGLDNSHRSVFTDLCDRVDVLESLVVSELLLLRELILPTPIDDDNDNDDNDDDDNDDNDDNDNDNDNDNNDNNDDIIVEIHHIPVDNKVIENNNNNVKKSKKDAKKEKKEKKKHQQQLNHNQHVNIKTKQTTESATTTTLPSSSSSTVNTNVKTTNVWTARQKKMVMPTTTTTTSGKKKSKTGKEEEKWEEVVISKQHKRKKSTTQQVPKTRK